MAQLDRSFVRLRFRLGDGNVKGRQRYTNTAAYIARRVAITYANNEYDEMRKDLQHQVAEDARRELVNMASLYRRFIVGANGSVNRPAGVLRSAIGGAAPMALSSALPEWAPRNAEYLRRKRNATGHDNWFDNRGWRARPTGRKGTPWKPGNSGLLFKESRADTWETLFGNISVQFRKSHQLEGKDAQATISVDGKKTRIKIGTLYVFALSKITPEMLPALRTGEAATMASDQGNPGLMSLVSAKSPELAYRLGRRSTLTRKYRPTLEPFLGYYLTRAVPAAIARRIKQSSLRRITRTS